MSASKSLLESLGAGKPRQEEPDGDSYEEMSGDGRSARHQAFAVQLVQANRDAQAVTYASMHSPIVFNPSRGIKFRFDGFDGLYEVVIEGSNLGPLYDRLCSGKREVIRVASGTVLAITVRPVPVEG
jgi:hypothetical protein